MMKPLSAERVQNPAPISDNKIELHTLDPENGRLKMINDFSLGMMSRRTLLMGAAMSGALQAFARDTPPSTDAVETTAGNPGKLKICIFSKHLQWTSVSDAAAIARDIGFDGVDLTVRAGGHVLPDRVEIDLPAAVEMVRRAGLQVVENSQSTGYPPI
jgi:hypothetical protein